MIDLTFAYLLCPQREYECVETKTYCSVSRRPTIIEV